MTSNSKISIAQQPGNKVCADSLATCSSSKSYERLEQQAVLSEVRLLPTLEGVTNVACKAHYLENLYMQEIDSLIDEFNIKQIGKENEAQSKNQFYMSKLNHLEFILNRPADHMFENSRNNNHFGSF